MLFSHWARGRLHSWTSGTLVWNIFQFFSLLASLPFSWRARAWHSPVVLLASAAELVAPTLFFFPPDKLAQGCLLCLRHFGHVLTAVRPKHGAVAGVCSFLKCHAVLRACVHISFSFFFFVFQAEIFGSVLGRGACVVREETNAEPDYAAEAKPHFCIIYLYFSYIGNIL